MRMRPSVTAGIALALIAATCGMVRAAWFIRGDVDGSGALDVTDPVRLIGYLFLDEDWLRSLAEQNGGVWRRVIP